jgi:SanA protein
MRRPRLRTVFGSLIAVTLLGVAMLGLSWWRVSRCGALVHDVPEKLPAKKVGLVLGCSPRLGNGSLNWFFSNRMDAAAQLFLSGKVEYLLVSGDNRRRTYDEPTEMKKALIARGVPAEKIVCDYAGLTTLDSMVRAKAVFGQESVIVVSQRFHNERAIYLAQAFGVDAVGYNASDVPMAAAPRTYLREILSRQRAWLDANIFRRKPRHLGPLVAIVDQPPVQAE